MEEQVLVEVAEQVVVQTFALEVAADVAASELLGRGSGPTGREVVRPTVSRLGAQAPEKPHR
ncbi:hypothetical protein ACWG5P_06215 [Streptomyces prasinus]